MITFYAHLIYFERMAIISSWGLPRVSNIKMIPKSAFRREVKLKINMQAGKPIIADSGGNIVFNPNITTHIMATATAKHVSRI